MPELVGFVDVGFLTAQGARSISAEKNTLNPDAYGVVGWMKREAESRGHGLLRVYWYDGQFDTSHPSYADQRRYFDGIASCPGIQLRLGHILSKTPPWQHALMKAVEACGIDPRVFQRHFTLRPLLEQKGVDTRIVLDLVRLAQRHAYDTAILLAGDRDLAEAVRVAQDEGRRVIIAQLSGGGLATELRHLADEVLPVAPTDVQSLLRPRSQLSLPLPDRE